MKTANTVVADEALVREARQVGKHKTRRQAVNAALKAYIKQRKQLRIMELEGKIDYRDDYDYKALRQRKRC